MNSTIEASNTPAELDQNLALTPENTLSLWTTVDLPGGVGLGGGAQYMDSVFRNTTNTTSVPSYWLINAMASYAVNTHLTLRLNGSNLGDTRVRRSRGRRALHSGPGTSGHGHGDDQAIVANADSDSGRVVGGAGGACASPARRRGVGRRPRHRRAPIRAGQRQRADSGRPSGRRASWARRSSWRAAAESAVHYRGAAAARLSAAVQSLLRRPVVRQPCRQLDPHRARHVASDSHRPVGDAVLLGAGGVRRRRADGRRHLRRAQREAARRVAWCCIPRPACITCGP